MVFFLKTSINTFLVNKYIITLYSKKLNIIEEHSVFYFLHKIFYFLNLNKNGNLIFLINENVTFLNYFNFVNLLKYRIFDFWIPGFLTNAHAVDLFHKQLKLKLNLSKTILFLINFLYDSLVLNEAWLLNMPVVFFGSYPMKFSLYKITYHCPIDSSFLKNTFFLIAFITLFMKNFLRKKKKNSYNLKISQKREKKLNKKYKVNL
jgi:hypothetical protein